MLIRVVIIIGKASVIGDAGKLFTCLWMIIHGCPAKVHGENKKENNFGAPDEIMTGKPAKIGMYDKCVNLSYKFFRAGPAGPPQARGASGGRQRFRA